ncbi:MAG TPA: S8 family peptidase [Povalibacter sp.]|uniref:S8 family peptidase n=1 Tax=Povalibacter sp. TaxID=1962978 RepID=UPI002BAB3926|nr:S8 family peptidase [Povalibacter sp.]HMN42935.1 S8 family peptidase [Povalibacter sp.]
MANNPVQVILNTKNYLERPEDNGGGSVKDFFKGRDAEFEAHKTKILGELSEIEKRLKANPDVGVEYAHVVLQGDAWAKTRRPTTAVFPPARTPIVGSGELGEMIVELTSENIAAVHQAVDRAEIEVAYKKNKKTDELVPNPSRARGEVGAIQILRPHEPTDRRRFSAEEAMNWLKHPQTGGVYIVETFADPREVASDTRRTRAKQNLDRLRMNLRSMPVEVVKPPARYEGSRLIFLRVADNARSKLTQHQAVLDVLDKDPAVRRIMLPPIVEVGHSVPGNPAGPATLKAPDETSQYPVVGVIDTGIAKLKALDGWCAGRTDFVGSTGGQDRSHGTFIAGLVAASDQFNDDKLFAEVPCKFFDLALHPTTSSGYQAFYPRGFLDFLEQLEIEILTAKATGVRVFNMSLALERQVADDAYGVFAWMLDVIADLHDVIFVLPAGNLSSSTFRSEWPDDPPDVLQMLADYRHTGKDRLLQPAESIRSLVVGALNPPKCSGPLRPTTYTRRGPSAALGMKPDVAHVGGRGSAKHELMSIDTSGNVTDGCGTSYAAPLVARQLAALSNQIEGQVERETLLALLIHHARTPKDLAAKSLRRIARDFVGFGLPAQSAQMLETEDHGITLLFNGVLERDRELVFPFSWPASLTDSSGNCRGRVKLTLVYRPPVDRSFDAEFVRVNLDAHLRQESFDSNTGDIAWTGRLRSETDKTYEKKLIEHGQKWSPVKQYEKKFQGIGASSQWRLVIEGLTRTGFNFPTNGVPFSVLLTIEDPKKTEHVFQELRQGLLAGGVKLADVRTANRITTRGAP